MRNVLKKLTAWLCCVALLTALLPAAAVPALAAEGVALTATSGTIAAGNSRATRCTETQAEAAAIARKIAINQGAECVIHGTDGRIRTKNSYGNDPFPPRG